jgi:hypothetical protein
MSWEAKDVNVVLIPRKPTPVASAIHLVLQSWKPGGCGEYSGKLEVVVTDYSRGYVQN